MVYTEQESSLTTYKYTPPPSISFRFLLNALQWIVCLSRLDCHVPGQDVRACMRRVHYGAASLGCPSLPQVALCSLSRSYRPSAVRGS